MSLQKTKREISWRLYAAAFVISAVIFGAGLFVGLQIEKSVADDVSKTVDIMGQRWMALETLLLMEDSPMFCAYMNEEMKTFDSETYELGRKIGYMEEKKGIDPQLKSEYMTLEMRDYLVAKKINERCGSETPIILYFVSSSGCQNCRQQGDELTRVHETEDVRVYTFDSDVDNSMATALAKAYGISTYPSMVVDGKTLTGFLTKDQIIANIIGG